MKSEISYNSKNLIIYTIKKKFTIEDTITFDNFMDKAFKKKIKTIALNMSEMTLIDSSAIGALIKGLNTAKGLNTNFIIYNIPDPILNIFKISYLDNFFQILKEGELKKLFPEENF